MTTQYSTTHRTNSATQLNTDIGINAKISIYAGVIPANVAAAVGTLIAQLTGNATAFGAAATGVLTASAITSANATGAGTNTASYFRIATSASADVVQGTVFMSTPLTTSALTAANGNVLTFAATTGVVVGMTVAGTGVLSGTTVTAVSGTTVTMSQTSTAGVANATVITFAGDCTIQNTSIANGQSVSISSLVITMNGA